MTMVFCCGCGKEIHSSTPVCPHCGAPQVANSTIAAPIAIPDGVKGWSWGAFVLNWLWAIFNGTWIGLLCFVPFVNIIMAFYLGFKGRELAWKNKKWESLEHFNRVQRKWSQWALVTLAIPVFFIALSIILSAFTTDKIGENNSSQLEATDQESGQVQSETLNNLSSAELSTELSEAPDYERQETAASSVPALKNAMATSLEVEFPETQNAFFNLNKMCASKGTLVVNEIQLVAAVADCESKFKALMPAGTKLVRWAGTVTNISYSPSVPQGIFSGASFDVVAEVDGIKSRFTNNKPGDASNDLRGDTIHLGSAMFDRVTTLKNGDVVIFDATLIQAFDNMGFYSGLHMPEYYTLYVAFENIEPYVAASSSEK